MKVAFFSTKKWVKNAFDKANKNHGMKFTYFEPKLDEHTVSLATGYDAVCVFVHDVINANVVKNLADLGVKTIALRCAGFNNVDLEKAAECGIETVRVPAYSPYAVAEHAIGMILALNRRYHRAHNRVREGNFSLDGLLGFDICGKTVGVIGTGKIGQIFARTMKGFNTRVLAYDKFPSNELEKEGIEYCNIETLYKESDIISLHCPLFKETFHMIDQQSLEMMKKGVMIINTSRGPLIDSKAVIAGLKSGKIGYLGLDVYEEEDSLFFEDLSDQVIQDDTFVRLETFPNVLITAHQAFFTEEAVDNIAETTIANLLDITKGNECPNLVKAG